MKIAMISGTYPPLKCGVGDFTCNLSRAFARERVEVDVLTSSGVSRTAYQDSKRVTVWPVVRSWGFWGVLSVARRLRLLGPDVIHFQYPTLVYGRKMGINILPVVLKILFPVLPQILTLHEFEQYGFFGRLRLAFNILAARVVFVSTERERKAVLRLFPFAGRKVHVVPIGSNIPAEGRRSVGLRLLRKLGVKRNEKSLVFFGWAGPGKGLPELLKAVGLLLAGGVKVRLVCVSEFEPRRDPFHTGLARLVRELKIGHSVTWTGFLPAARVSSILKACDVCILPFEDGLKMNRGSFTAALVNGARIVTTFPASGAVPAFVRKLPVVFSRPSAECLAQAIRRTLSAGSGPRFTERNRAQVSRMLSWESVAGRYLDILSRRELIRSL